MQRRIFAGTEMMHSLAKMTSTFRTIFKASETMVVESAIQDTGVAETKRASIFENSWI